MTMHPELKHALDTGVSIPEVIKIFAKHHSGQREEQVHFGLDWARKDAFNKSELWDHWNPLFRRLGVYVDNRERPIKASEMFLNIHRALTKDVVSWLCDSKRKNNVYLISEPWMPDDSTHECSRAAVVANICWDAQRLGFFELHSLHYTNATLFDINQISAALAATYSPYRRILTQILTDNPRVRELPPRTRFKKFIQEPWKILQQCCPEYAATPPVIVLRWDSKRHEELCSLICEFGSSHLSPLLWVISVDLEFKPAIADFLDPLVPFRYTRLPVGYDEVSVDTALILRYRFGVLRHKCRGLFDDNEVWPSKEQMSHLIRIVWGVFEFVDVIIQFVDWEDDGGPRAHLETFLGYMADSPSPSDKRRYSALDHFYTRALSSIPPHLIFDMKKAFSITRWFGHSDNLYSDVELFCLLYPAGDTYLPYIQRFIVADCTAYSGKRSCTYFRRFLEDRNRSGHFYTPISESRLQAVQAWLHFLSDTSDLPSLLKPVVAQCTQSTLEPISATSCRVYNALCDMGIHGTDLTSLLRRFDFRCLAYTCDNINLAQFTLLIKHLYKWDKGNSPSIVRVEPLNDLDRRFINKCNGLAEPLDLEDEGKEPFMGPKYVLISDGAETVLAVMASRLGYYKTMEGVDVEEDGGVNIYTSAMLEYM